MSKSIYIKQPLVPNSNGCHVIQVPSGNLDVEGLLEHIDYQLGTSFVHMLFLEKEESYEEGRAAVISESEPGYEPDPDANYRIETAVKTGWVPQCAKQE